MTSRIGARNVWRLFVSSRPADAGDPGVGRTDPSAIGIAEVTEGLATLVSVEFGFLAFVFGQLFFAVGIGIAGGEHGVGLGSQALLLAEAPEFVTHLSQR